MYIILGNNDNYIPANNIKAVVPFSRTNPEEGCTVLLMSGENFKIEGKSPKDIFDSMCNVPYGFRVVAESFQECTSKLSKDLTKILHSIDSHKTQVDKRLNDISNTLQSKGCNIEDTLSSLKSDIVTSREDVLSECNTLSSAIDKFKGISSDLGREKRILSKSLSDLDELLRAEADLLKGYDCVPEEPLAPKSKPLTDEELGI